MKIGNPKFTGFHFPIFMLIFLFISDLPVSELVPKLKISPLDFEYGTFNRATDNENNSETFIDVGIK
jgi:hypothetical protein